MKNITLKKEDIGKGELVLINPDYTLKSTINNLVSFDEEYNNIKLNNIANYSLHLILNNINAENKIVPVSGYRTLEEQKDIYNTSLKENGREYTQKYVALPNASEHQTGLAIDLALNEGNIDFICPKFPYYGICQNFRNIAPKYGFIERYKDEKKAITKISKEEWHFRYVGYPHSKIITENNIRNKIKKNTFVFRFRAKLNRPGNFYVYKFKICRVQVSKLSCIQFIFLFNPV